MTLSRGGWECGVYFFSIVGPYSPIVTLFNIWKIKFEITRSITFFHQIFTSAWLCAHLVPWVVIFGTVLYGFHKYVAKWEGVHLWLWWQWLPSYVKGYELSGNKSENNTCFFVSTGSQSPPTLLTIYILIKFCKTLSFATLVKFNDIRRN